MGNHSPKQRQWQKQVSKKRNFIEFEVEAKKDILFATLWSAINAKRKKMISAPAAESVDAVDRKCVIRK